MRPSIALASAAVGAMLILRCLAVHARSPGHASEEMPAASGATLIVRAQPVRESFRAYARIQPVAITQVHAVEAGVVRRLVLPGERVTAGQVLAVLGGAQAESLLAQLRGALRAASIQLAADRRKLTTRLVTRQTVAADQAAYAAARGRLQVALETLTLRVPAAGQVLAVEAADGEQVAAGQLILSLETSRPWLQATYYGSDALAIRPGMTGRFQPVSGAAIPVRVRTVSQALQSDGGEQVGLFPVLPRGHDTGSAPAGRWRSGEWGTVTLQGQTREMVAVPTRALIFDRARWWVLVRTPRGDRRQAVVPGRTSGWMTFVSRGLKPGERIVVQNAYLEFHRGISRRYIPPD